MKVLIVPHPDDEVLWTSFTIQKHNPFVIIVLGESYIQYNRGTGITSNQRKDETVAAMNILGAQYMFLPIRDDNADPTHIERMLRAITEVNNVEHAWIPAVEENGNVHHNLIGEIGARVFPSHTKYLTYTTSGKSTHGTQVPIEDPSWVLKKLQALACYTSQINLPSTQPHFMREQWEYVL